MATEEAIKEAMEQGTTLTTSTDSGGNVEAFMTPIKAQEEVQELKQDFREFMESLPRKQRRRYLEHRKFGNTLEAAMRAKRLSSINKV